MFTDFKDFTRLSEKFKSEELVDKIGINVSGILTRSLPSTSLKNQPLEILTLRFRNSKIFMKK